MPSPDNVPHAARPEMDNARITNRAHHAPSVSLARIEPRAHSWEARVKQDRLIQIDLFEDVWQIAFRNPLPTSLIPHEVLARIKAAPRNTEFARARRQVVCTPREAQQLARVYRVAASAYAVMGDRHRLELAADGSRLVIEALLKASIH